MLNKKFCYPKVERAAKKFRRELINDMTRYERITLKYLRELDYKIEIQKIIFHDVGHFYIADFYLPDYRIVIEVDGKQHYKKEGLTNDYKRTKALLDNGVSAVIRFPNNMCIRGDYFKSILRKRLHNCIKNLNYNN